MEMKSPYGNCSFIIKCLLLLDHKGLKVLQAMLMKLHFFIFKMKDEYYHREGGLSKLLKPIGDFSYQEKNRFRISQRLI